MKADLTLRENQAAFKAMYLNQPVLRHRSWNQEKESWELNPSVFSATLQERWYLSLRHISSLTEEEMKEIINFFPYRGNKNIFIQMILLNEWTKNFDNPHKQCSSDDFIHLGDYLRGEGFLIPWRGNSCEEIISSGLALYGKI